MRKGYALVVVDIAAEKLDRPFTYRIPEALAEVCVPGAAVRIPFGNGNREIAGYVVGLTDRCEFPPEKVKDIIRVTAGDETAEGKLVALAAWMSHRYGSTMIRALKTVIPVRRKVDAVTERTVTLADPGHARALLAEYERKHFAAKARVLRTLLSAEGGADADESGMGSHLLTESGVGRTVSMDMRALQKQASVPASVVRSLEKEGILHIAVTEIYRRVAEEAMVSPPDVLTAEQESACAAIRREWYGAACAPGSGEACGFDDNKGHASGDSVAHAPGSGGTHISGRPELCTPGSGGAHIYGRPELCAPGSGRPVLLQGITGSGKTVVYVELVAEVLARGEQAIVLIPEIALTWQTVLRFVRRFGDRVSFLHSRLSTGERYDQMKAARAGDISVMVGPRSALFTPFPKLGLIIIDEEHEESYHSELMPRYYAGEVALKRGALEGARVLFGSATPSLQSAYRAETGEYLGVTLASRFGGSVLPHAEIVDMREELKQGNRSILSDTLRRKIEERLSRGEQVMLFLNRRGYAGAVTCRSCGHVIRCPHCDVSLTRHRNGKLICHYCGYETADVKTCPDCHSPHIGALSIGTEQVEELMERTYPAARLLRMDLDTTRGKEGHARILKRFSEGNADILIGTQMIVKGHDFPNVTLVGVLLADLSLTESDYRSSERTYQLIAQAVGRAGRGQRRGEAVIQTYAPEHFAIRAAAVQDYGAFFQEEMAFRKLLSYPPAGGLLAVLGQAPDERLLGTGMGYLRRYIDRIDPGGKLMAIGPAPQSIGRIKDQYRQVIYLRHERREALIAAKDYIEEYIELNSGFDGIHIMFDFQ